MPEAVKRSPAIVFLVFDYFPSRGGTTTQTRLHAIEFLRRGWDVTVLTRRVPDRLGSERLEGIQVRRIALPGRGRLAKWVDVLASWLWLLRRRRSFSAVSVIMDADLALAARAAGLGSSTVLTWVTRGDATRRLGGRIGRIRRRLLGNCKQVVLSPRMETELRELGIPDVAVIPVPVDTTRFHPPTGIERSQAVRELHLRGGATVLFVGHLQERKGVDLLIRAFGLVLDAGQDANLVLVGGPIENADHGYMELLKGIIHERELGDRVVFAGPKDDVAPYMFAADVFCLPSHREGMPNVLLEAMACGLACVAPASAGGDELLFGSVGVIPPSNSPVDLAHALIPLLADPDDRRALGTSAAARVRSDHQPDRIVDSYEALWHVGSTGLSGEQLI